MLALHCQDFRLSFSSSTRERCPAEIMGRAVFARYEDVTSSFWGFFSGHSDVDNCPDNEKSVSEPGGLYTLWRKPIAAELRIYSV